VSDGVTPDKLTNEVPLPVEIAEAPPSPPAGSFLFRGLGALAKGRLPHKLRASLDRALTRLGFRYKRVRVNGHNIVMRRTSWDEGVVHCVLIRQDYTPPWFSIEPGDTVIDIGGNIGCFAVLAAKRARRGRVLVFEPESENYRLLCRNVQANHLSNVQAEHAAVAGRPGTITLFKAPHGPLHTTIPKRLGDAAESEVVTAVTLADIFDRYRVSTCNFLKLDCESAEYEILYNTPAEYLRRIDKIALEYHAQRDKQRTAGKLVAFLEAHGFHTVEFTDFVGHDAGFIKARRTAPGA
jgi:FkbM family methyltransferase